MISDKLICYDIEPLNSDMTVGDALRKLNSLHLDLLPVVSGEKLMNYAKLDVLESTDKNSKLSTLPVFASVLPVVQQHQHLLDALSHLKTLDVSLMAVLDENGNYTGVLKTRDVVQAFSRSISIRNGGSILVLRVRPIDYSLSDISRIVEYSDAKILGVFLFEIPESSEFEVHLKLNTSVLKHILATLERYDYKVVRYYNREDLTDDSNQRYENLMKYLDV